jgi:phage terminase large subunit GpA-like protein
MRRKRTIQRRTLKLFDKISGVLAPPPKMTISEWADSYRFLSKESSSESGRWNTDRAPYQREIMDAASDNKVEIVIVMTSAQIGKTEILNNIMGYHIDYDPAPIMLVVPTVELAKSWSKKRLAPMIRDTPALRDKISDAKSRDSDNTILEKGFPGGYIVMVGANSPTGLSSRPIRILLADEVDRFPVSAGDEGDPLDLAEKRTKTFYNHKKVFVSTPTIKGVSRIEKEYENSTKEEWCLPCPVCGRYQPIEWGRIKFNDVTMECKYCMQRFNEHEWKSGKGRWISQNQKVATKKIRGFHLNALASPWEKWSVIIDEFLKAKRKGAQSLKTFVNTYLGESWEEDAGETTDKEDIIKRREMYNAEVPEGVLVLTAGVDTQEDRLEVEVVGWGVGKESWGIEYQKFYGLPSEDDVWERMDQFLSKEYLRADGIRMKIRCTCIDSGGHNAQDVYRFTKPREIRRIFSIKGKGGTGIPFVGKATRNNRERAALFSLGVDEGKETIYARLQKQFVGQGYCHFPIEDDRNYNQDYFEGLCSEKRIEKYVKGKKTYQWVKIKSGIRNEPLDLRNYATAALEILNPDMEYLSKHKQKISAETTKKPKVKKKKRRVISKGI